MALDQQSVLDALKVVTDPDLHRDIVSLGFVKNVNIWELETAPGEKFGLMGVTSIDDAFSRLTLGDAVTVIRYADKKSGNGRKMHDIRVFKAKN